MPAQRIVLRHKIVLEFDDHRVDVRAGAGDDETLRRQRVAGLVVLDEQQRRARDPVYDFAAADQHVGNPPLAFQPGDDLLQLALVFFELLNFRGIEIAVLVEEQPGPDQRERDAEGDELGNGFCESAWSNTYEMLAYRPATKFLALSEWRT